MGAVTQQERELFLKAVGDLTFVAHKPEPPVSKSTPKRSTKPYDIRLDLHGLYAEQALKRVHACLIRASQLGKKRILIIHGKGSGILRYEVRTFLANSSLVTQVQDVPVKLGGEGAILVLVRAKLDS